MSITVEIGLRLLSGKTVTVQADLDETVASFNLRAQTALAVGLSFADW